MRAWATLIYTARGPVESFGECLTWQRKAALHMGFDLNKKGHFFSGQKILIHSHAVRPDKRLMS